MANIGCNQEGMEIKVKSLDLRQYRFVKQGQVLLLALVFLISVDQGFHLSPNPKGHFNCNKVDMTNSLLKYTSF